jgi:hypothetical protein
MIYVSSSSTNNTGDWVYNTTKERIPAYWIILTKIVSGRFVLTVVASICFLIIVDKLMIILMSKVEDLDTGQILLLVSNLALVIQNVFNSYFSKKRLLDNSKINNGNSNGTDSE